MPSRCATECGWRGAGTRVVWVEVGKGGVGQDVRAGGLDPVDGGPRRSVPQAPKVGTNEDSTESVVQMVVQVATEKRNGGMRHGGARRGTEHGEARRPSTRGRLS